MTESEKSLFHHYQSINQILKGEKEGDLIIKNLKILDTLGESVNPGSLLIWKDQIIALNPNEEKIKSKEIFDGNHLYGIPGLIDAHFHFESQLANPESLGHAMLPKGTTTCMVECLDFVSAAKEEGGKAAKELFKGIESLPYDVFAFAPGKKVSKEIIEEILALEGVIGLGEFDHFMYSLGNDTCFELMAKAKTKGLMANGHWGLTTLNEQQLNLLPAMGADNNHDVWSEEDLKRV